jgi:GNAT superfamily N-acetyltransferase
MAIEYSDNAVITVEQAIDLYTRSTLGERRPVQRPDIFESMLKHSNLTISAWEGARLVGIARALTDFSYVAYLSDLAVDAACQKRGIGRRLVAEVKQRLWPECMIVLLAAPAANEYYAKLGFEPNPRGWVLRGEMKKQPS